MRLITSTSTGVALGAFVLVAMSIFLIKSKKVDRIRQKTKLPKEIFALLVSGIILILLIFVALGPTFVFSQIREVKNSLITPITDRFGLTVAENKQPYFSSDWRGSFGPIVLKIPLFFWLFFTGSIMLFHHLIKELKKKDKRILTLSYFIFLICLILLCIYRI